MKSWQELRQGYRRTSRWVRWPLEMGLVIALLLALRTVHAPEVRQGLAPDFVAQTLTGERVSREHLQGEASLLIFWAQWCAICKLELPWLLDLVDRYPVVTFAMQSGEDAEVQAFLEQQGWQALPVVNDPHGYWAQAYGVRGVPVMFVLDPQGRIRFTETGLTSPWGLRVRLWWAGLSG
ncbi:redoxin domain-containing protein [Nitrincola tapanii]|uniref:Redoxin domain-containing protein n=1 Tax=Nitrincola tapanii TaxID=1708751 RepID=A0A5A9W0D4_9GAMM|nr:redoxin domain-containing protein [Nitrincola tapanii]KAA0874220.1 redoxin domain-containing protein [Nitrincola tapanii]